MPLINFQPNRLDASSEQQPPYCRILTMRKTVVIAVALTAISAVVFVLSHQLQWNNIIFPSEIALVSSSACTTVSGIALTRKLCLHRSEKEEAGSYASLSSSANSIDLSEWQKMAIQTREWSRNYNSS